MPVRTAMDPAVAAACVRRFARELGATRKQAAELAIVTSELAANAVRHAGGGIVRARGAAGSIEIECADRGRGEPDELRARAHQACAVIAPGRPLEPPFVVSLRLGLGHGLGAVARLSDSFAFEARRGGGVVARARRAVGAGAR